MVCDSLVGIGIAVGSACGRLYVTLMHKSDDTAAYWHRQRYEEEKIKTEIVHFEKERLQIACYWMARMGRASGFRH